MTSITGPCGGKDQMLTLSQATGRLVCRNNKCHRRLLHFNGGKPQHQLRLPSFNYHQRQLIPIKSDDKRNFSTEAFRCHALGSWCSQPPFILFGLDVFDKERRSMGSCYDISSLSLPSEEEDDELDIAYNQISPHLFDIYRPTFTYHTNNKTERVKGRRQQRRQATLTSGIFQLPGSLPEPLLNPCRPGKRFANNFKCTNPLTYVYDDDT